MEVELVKDSQGVEAGRHVSSNPLASSSSQASHESNCNKNSDKSRGSFVPFVISFSDDDSGSDSEDTRQRKILATESRSLSLDKSRKPPQAAVAVRRPQKLEKVMRNEAKMTRKMPHSHTFVSSLPKISGTTSKSGGSSLNVGNRNKFKKTTGPSLVRNTDAILDNSKLQDLRQLIAVRENQLKRKCAQQSRNVSSTKCRDPRVTVTSIAMTSVRRATDGENLHPELKEPSNKLQRISEDCSSQMVQNVQVIDTALASEKSMLENCGQLGQCDRNSCNEKFPSGEPCTGLGLHHSENENHGSIFLTKLASGTDVVTSRSQSGWKTNLRDRVMASEQAAVANKSSEVELKDPTKLSNQFVPEHAGKSLTGRSGSLQVRSNERSGSLQVRSNEQPLQLAIQDVNQNIELLPSNLRQANISGNSSMDLQSLLDMEELHDKELEEAQEYRHKCEIEERNALKAYRKAQKALIEANARCSALFSKREKYSAQLRVLMIENPDVLFSTGSQLSTGGALNPSTTSGANMPLIPSSCCPSQLAFNGNDVDFHSGFDAPQNVSDMHVDRDKLASDPFSEPDVSTSELNKENHEAHGVCLQSDDVSMSMEEEDAYRKSPQNSSEYQGEGTFGVAQGKEVNNGSGRQLLTDSSQDSLLLEASLRSQLFERLKMKTLPKKLDQSHSVEPMTESMLEVDVGQRMGISSGNISSSEVEKEKEKASDFQVFSDKADVESDVLIEINGHCNNEKFGSNFTPPLSTDHLGSCISIDDHQSQSSSSATFSLPALRSAFSHLKVLGPTNSDQLQTRSMNIQASHVHDENDDGNMGNIMDTYASASMDLRCNVNGSYFCKFAIDPLWPLCMYELRGKCNNNECTWQHFRDYSCENNVNTTCNSSDFKDGSAIHGGKFCATNSLTMSLDCLLLAPPTYLVGFNVLKTDLHSCKSIGAQSFSQHQLKCYSGFLVLSSLLPTDLASKEPFLHGSEARVEVHGGWNRQLLYFHSRNGTLVEGDRQFSDNDQSVELALLSLCQEANKSKGRIEALKVLSRAIEADPTSALLWIVYLLIYYSNQKCIGKDDMFQYAVEHNEEAYELWVLYINSREMLDERLTAYDAAISALCRHASTSNRATPFASECILDIVLQMMNFLCMSGNAKKAIEKIHELFPTTKGSDKAHQLFLPDIVMCLAISDKCIFWVCCVYMVVYRRLPNAIVKQLECQKELSAIEWSSTQLTADEKQQAVSLMELAVDSLALYIDRESLENESNLRAAHLFALNHVRCIAVLEGLECSRNLLERYIKLYPSCLELVLMSARLEHDFCNSSYEGFEEALDNWLDEVPGVQCIWNQYAECAFRDGRLDVVKEVMDRWLQSLDRIVSKGSNDSPQLASVSDVHSWLSGSSQNDIVFGLLNSAIYKLLQNDQTESRLALDRALGSANHENYSHCVRELILFLTADSLQCNDCTRVGSALQVLRGYLFDTRASLASEPLSRKFIQNIKKPGLKQLVGKLLSPVPSDPSLVNSILEVLFGPTLLPHTYSKLSDMVDLVESLMEILPSNYHLAISVCKWLSRVSNTTSLSANVSFWASSLLSNALLQAIPVAAEHVWVEAANLLRSMTNSLAISINFHRRALSIYPFSINLWKSYVNLSMATGDAESVKEAAREKGIDLD
ncbi:PREDICTED: uncharacterized protein LOC109187173 isoform X3 [Ipomoea nil]|nr:PREDICTED: uncharacterized protein LOC109187173 isoform X3 [Ipomoea nil]